MFVPTVLGVALASAPIGLRDRSSLHARGGNLVRSEVLKVADAVVQEVVRRMTAQAVRRTDGVLVFAGSPRGIMEELGVSSGQRYKELYTLGFRRVGRGKTAQWVIPEPLPPSLSFG